ncbi:HAD family hydrolase [Candidatus Lokiarchaeum ossiferum]|uniref:HAD family hydrolase n=1 Tax=Candidatus Lokiarchaeum ossiferum TaxID=2951803 RepID=UPI00352BDE2B
MSSKTAHPPIILFDFDGVILNSTGSLMAMEISMKDDKYQWNKELLKHYTPMDIIRLFEKATQPKNRDLIKALHSYFTELLPKRLKRLLFFIQTGRLSRKLEWIHSDFYPNYASTFNQLIEKGIILGIVTNSGKKRIMKWLHKKNAERYFTNMVTRKDRKELGTKPSPKPILGLLDRLKNQFKWDSLDLKKVAFVGDNISDIIAAQKAKVTSIACSKGHGDPEEIQKLRPSFIFSDITEIPTHLAKIFPNLFS